MIYGEGEDSFAGVVGRSLRARGYTLAIAESCTGGLVGHMLTREPGASDFLLVDAVTYANSAKTRLLGVSEDVLRGHGAVSAEVAAAMAEGVRRVSGADIALSLTGVAGPSGGSAEKPVGTVYLALASSKGTLVKHRVFGGERGYIQTLASYAGLPARPRSLRAVTAISPPPPPTPTPRRSRSPTSSRARTSPPTPRRPRSSPARPRRRDRARASSPRSARARPVRRTPSSRPSPPASPRSPRAPRPRARTDRSAPRARRSAS